MGDAKGTAAGWPRVCPGLYAPLGGFSGVTVCSGMGIGPSDNETVGLRGRWRRKLATVSTVRLEMYCITVRCEMFCRRVGTDGAADAS
eukprot:27253-Eustigmatos_ZCMA.PRE.1